MMHLRCIEDALEMHASPHTNMSDDDNDGDETFGEKLTSCFMNWEFRRQRVLYHDMVIKPQAGFRNQNPANQNLVMMVTAMLNRMGMMVYVMRMVRKMQ